VKTDDSGHDGKWKTVNAIREHPEITLEIIICDEGNISDNAKIGNHELAICQYRASEKTIHGPEGPEKKISAVNLPVKRHYSGQHLRRVAILRLQEGCMQGFDVQY
jgi:hypothetical protein